MIVADEPVGNLDTQTAAEMLRLFDRLVDKGRTLLIVTHDRELSQQMQRVTHLLNGRVGRDRNSRNLGETQLGGKLSARHLSQ